MAEHNELGKLGEQKAFEYLVAKGYRVVARNWRFRHKEVDIIAYDRDILVVVEVKTRNSSQWEHPRETITPLKIRYLVLAADVFVHRNRIDNKVRFDVISCMPLENDVWDIDHIQDAFTAQVE